MATIIKNKKDSQYCLLLFIMHTSTCSKKPAKWDPNLSETYKVLQEADYDDQRPQHVSQPTRQGVFTPQMKVKQNRVRIF